MATNPYLPQQAQAVTQQANNNLFNYQLPQINSGAIAAGGFGGSRHGVAQGLAIGQTNQALSGALAGLYGGAYESDQNRALQNKSLDNSYNLGLGNLDLGRTQTANNYSLGQGQLALGNKQADNSYGLGLGQLGLGARSADTSQFNAETSRGLGYGQLQQQGEQNNFNNQLAGYGAQLQGLNALQNWNNMGLGMANQQQQTPIQNLGLLSNIGASIGGQGSSSTTPGYSSLQGALGGAMTAAQLWQLLANKG